MAASTTRTVKAKFDGDAKGMIAAAKAGEEATEHFVKDTEKKFRQSGDKAGKGFGASLKKWFRGEGGGLFKEIGKSGGTVFGSGLLGALKTPILGPALVASITAVALAVLPAAGAIAGGALVAGFGAGLAGLGLVFAAKSEVVQQKWKRTLGQLGADMRLLSKPFEGTLVHIADIFERTVDQFNPHLAKAFAKMADPIEDFADDAGRALEELIPAIDPVTDAFDRVLDSLGPAMQSALREVSAGVQDLARSVEQNPEALADTVRGIGEFIRTGLRLVTTLNEVNGKFEELTGGVSLVDVTMEGLQATLMPLLTLFAGVEKGLDLVNAAMHDSEASGASMSKAANDVVNLANAYQKTGAAAKGVPGPVETAAEAVARSKKEAADAKAKFEELITSMFRVSSAALTLSGAAISVEQALDDASRSVKENGRTLDIHTEKGRNNRLALDRLAAATNEQTESMIRNKVSTATAAKTAEASKANFIRLAQQMGLSKKAAQAMAATMIAIPNVSRQAKLTADKRDLETKLASVKRQLADPKLTATKRARLTADKAQLEAAIARAKAAIASIQGKTVYITAIVRQRGAIKAADPRLGDPGRASGGLMQPGRRYLVGERRREIVEMGQNGGARVISGEQTPRELAAAAPGPIYLETHIEVGGEVVRVVRSELRQQNRQLKATVKAGGN